MEEEEEGFLTVQEVANKLRVDDNTVRHWITDGTLEAVALPKRGKRQSYRIRQSAYNRLVARRDK